MIPTTDIFWPEELGCFHRDDYGLQDLPTFEATQYASGRSSSIRKFSFVPTDVDVSMVMTSPQALAFGMFYRDMLNDGVKWFNAELKTPRSDRDLMVVKFKSPPTGPKLHQNGDRWIYRATLQTFERPLWPAPWGQLPGWVEGASRFDVLMNWVWPEVQE